MSYPKNILVTGCSGYIGSHFVRRLKEEFNCIIYGTDNVLADNETLKFIDCFTYSNITNQNPFGYIPNLHEFDSTVHLAAKVNVGESVQNPYLYYNTNIFGTSQVLKLPTKNFIFASTGAAEKMENPYGISKRAAEDIVRQNRKSNLLGQTDYTIFRFYNVIGKTVGNAPKNPDGLFHNLIKAKSTGKFTIFGGDYNTFDGTAIRDYVHVDEICKSLLKAIEKPSKKTENLGRCVGYSVKNIVETFKKVNKCDFQVGMGPRRKGDIEKSVLSKASDYMEKIYSLEEMLEIK